MTLAHLVSCPSCTRHVRASEASCPFCSTAIPDGVRAAQPRRAPAERLSRAALYAFGVGSLTAAAACSSTNGPVAQPLYGAPAADAAYDGPVGQPHYGAPAMMFDGGFDSPVGQPLYGASFDSSIPGIDSGADADTDAPLGQPFYGAAQEGGVVSDAGGHDGPIGQPPYGIGIQDNDGEAPSGH